jgi:hypothetical protein
MPENFRGSGIGKGTFYAPPAGPVRRSLAFVVAMLARVLPAWFFVRRKHWKH